MDINKEYYVMIDDFSDNERLHYRMGEYASNFSYKFQYEGINRPIKYDIRSEYWQKGRSPADIILLYNGLIIKDKLKTEFFDPLSSDNILTHLSFFVSPDDDYFEGYWLLSTPHKPKDWLDSDKTEFRFRNSDNSIRGVNSYYLNETLLKDIPLEKRQLFTWDYDTLGDAHQIIHKSYVDFLRQFENRNLKFIPLLKFKSNMANEGPLPDFAI